MKKTILLFSAIFLLWSCNNETNNTTIPQNSASIYKKESVLGISKHFSGILTEKYSNGQLKKSHAIKMVQKMVWKKFIMKMEKLN